MSELKTCPFCGGTPKLSAFYDIDNRVWEAGVECQACEVGMYVYERPDQECAELDASTKWNRRAYEGAKED